MSHEADLNIAARKFSAVYPVMDNADLRRTRGLKIAAILKEALAGKPIQTLLDIGCSNSLVLDTVTEVLGPRYALGIDMDSAVAPSPSAIRGLVIGDAMQLPFPAACVDVVICNHTYEHVPKADQLFVEIDRVLVPDGIVYFSAMNARWPIEPHYHLPLLHWMPRWISSKLLKRCGFSAGYLEKPLSTPKLKALVSAFEIDDYTLKVITAPERYHAADIVKRSAFSGLYRIIAETFYGFLPGYLWILRKPANRRGIGSNV